MEKKGKQERKEEKIMKRGKFGEENVQNINRDPKRRERASGNERKRK